MKKTYIMPLTEVVKTEVEHMLNDSFGLSSDTLTGLEDGFEKASREDLDAIFEGLW